MMGAAIQSADLGIGRLREQLAAMGRTKILIGVQGDDARAQHPNAAPGTSVGLIAFWLHFGTRSQPARPYIDRAIAEITGEVSTLAKRAVSDLVDGRADTAADALERMAERGLEVVRESIETAKSWAPPLAPLTIKRKGHDVPLIDTGTVRDATSYTIREGEQVLKKGRAYDP